MYSRKKQIIQRTPAECNEFSNGLSALDLNPILQRVYLNRSINDSKYLDYSLSQLVPPDKLKDGDRATEILAEAVINQKKILILGDYDTDGATATALAILALKQMGAARVEYLVPNRFEYGYGLSVEIAKVACQMEPDLVITVDNGISSVDGVQALTDSNIRVIITDHHLAGSKLPAADAILNPNQPDCQFSEKSIAGVGVMFYLLLLLRAHLKQIHWFENSNIAVPNLAQYLDLVALGTVADLVPLEYNNRILVAQGLARIRSGKCRPGILALMEVAGRAYQTITSTDFGFAIAPRLNAAGRLDDISCGIECLLSENSTVARKYAAMLNQINCERRKIESRMQSQALKVIQKLELNAELQSTKGHCLYQSDWHQGITGLVASRIKDKTDQPVIAFANSGDGCLSGSARSITGLHIKDLLDTIAHNEPDLIEKFGGHAMAAGLTIKMEHYSRFKKTFEVAVTDQIKSMGSVNELYTDGSLSATEITLGNAECLKSAAPWGQGFPAPLFHGKFNVVEQKVVGKNHLKLRLASMDRDYEFDAIAFRSVENGEQIPEFDQINTVYQLDVNEFRGRRSVQLIIEYFQPCE